MPNIKKSKTTGRFVEHAQTINRVCENCGITFKIKTSSLKYGRGKCCSRKCVDENKKQTYSGKNNPSYGRIQSVEERQKRHESVQKTMLKKYGKTSVELMLEHLGKKSETNIETKLYVTLDDMKVKYEKKYKIWITDIHYREYDAYIPDMNLLIEVDGDYWHGNPSLYSVFDETQKKMKDNDIFKESLAKYHNKILIRFWETDVKNERFAELLKEAIWQKK